MNRNTLDEVRAFAAVCPSSRSKSVAAIEAFFVRHRTGLSRFTLEWDFTYVGSAGKKGGY